MNEKTKKIILNLSIAGIVTVSAIAGVAYAKYISKINGNGKLEVAKWSFLVNNSDESFGTIDMGRKQYTAETLKAGKIAPGTQGEFDIDINAVGTETAVDYSVIFSNVQNKPDNLYFTVGDSNTKLKDFSELADALKGRIEAGNTSETKKVTVKWTWDYETEWNGKTIEENDAKDTEQGKNANEMKFDVAVVGTQVKPQLQ